jgi:UDP-N-acetylglucosamine 2-epimerase (non-hydrolysing)
MVADTTILIVFGTRPEAIKMAPVVLELGKVFNVRVCVTAQHREMLDQVLDIFHIFPHYDLDIMQPGQDLFDVTTSVLQGLKMILLDVDPDMVLVHGDTSTSMATSLASFYLDIPVGHVEAGLRTYNMRSPFPEEFNRKVTTQIAKFHFAPTEKSRENLLNDHVPENNIIVTGNTVIDALFSVVENARKSNYPDDLLTKLPFLRDENDALPRIILVTGHRRENFGLPFEDICHALRDIAQRYTDVEIVYPVHLNPNVRGPVMRILSNIHNVHLIDPIEYLPFIKLMDSSYLIITDSGGIQEEAPSLGKPVLVMRDTTERPEAVEAGTVKLIGTNKQKIIDAVTKLLTDDTAYKIMARAHNPYGDGKACKRICKLLEEVMK